MSEWLSELLADLAVQVAAYRAWMDGTSDDPNWAGDSNAMAWWDEKDWLEVIALSAIDIADEYGGVVE